MSRNNPKVDKVSGSKINEACRKRGLTMDGSAGRNKSVVRKKGFDAICMRIGMDPSRKNALFGLGLEEFPDNAPK